MAKWPDNPGGRGRPGADIGGALAPLDGRPGPARRLHRVVSAEIVHSVLERALETPGAVRPPRDAPRWRRVLAVAAVLAAMVGPGATAVAWHYRLIDLGVLGVLGVLGEDPAAERPGTLAAAAPPTQEVVVPPAVFEPLPERPVRAVRKRKVRTFAAAPPRWSAPAPDPGPRPPVAAPAPALAPAVVVPENLPPEDLLASANDLRKRREWRGADVFYGAVVSRFSASDAAVVAEVASAALHLQHLEDAPGALAAYRRALEDRPSGPLAEEARWGIAAAHRVLGDPHAEALALREFLQWHPRSALAQAAERRLARVAR